MPVTNCRKRRDNKTMSLKEFGQVYSRLPQTGKKKDVVNVTKNMLFIIYFLCINLKIIAVSLFLHKDLI